MPHSATYDYLSRSESKPSVVVSVLYSLKHNDLVAALAKPVLSSLTRRLERVIFTATTGRSGTMTLAKLFSIVPDCVALHEPGPQMHGRVLKAASYGDPDFVSRVYRQHKSLNILRAAIGYRYYMEANELFIKTFIQHAIDDFGDRMTIIHLVRRPIEVAMSLFRLQHYPGTDIGNEWFLDFRAPTNLIQIADLLDADAEFSHPFYKALWYWYEIEMRISAWRSRNPSLKIIRFETDWFNDKCRIIEFFDKLGIGYDKSRIDATVGRKENLKKGLKHVAPLPREQARRMVFRFQELLTHRGVDQSIFNNAGRV
jgi:hypothetical protein